MKTAPTQTREHTSVLTLDHVVQLLRKFQAQREEKKLVQWFKKHVSAYKHQAISDEFAQIMQFMLKKPVKGFFRGSFHNCFDKTATLCPVNIHGELFSCSELINDQILWKDIEPQLRMATCPTGEHKSHIVFRLTEDIGYKNNGEFESGVLELEIIGCNGEIVEYDQLV